jgi:hypothetical protein
LYSVFLFCLLLRVLILQSFNTVRCVARLLRKMAVNCKRKWRYCWCWWVKSKREITCRIVDLAEIYLSGVWPFDVAWRHDFIWHISTTAMTTWKRLMKTSQNFSFVILFWRNFGFRLSWHISEFIIEFLFELFITFEICKNFNERGEVRLH